MAKHHCEDKYITLLDLARQAKIITGNTACFDGKIEAGIPFSGYPTGVDVTTTGSTGIVNWPSSGSTAVFSGNVITTVFDVANPTSPNFNPIFSSWTSGNTWTNPVFSANTSGLTLPISPFSGGSETQHVGPVWTLSETGMTGDHIIATQYTGYTVTYTIMSVVPLSPLNNLFTGRTFCVIENFTAGTLDYKGPVDYLRSREDGTIDNRLTTKKLRVTGGASASTIGYVLTQVDEIGSAEWVFNSASASTNTFVVSGSLDSNADLNLLYNTGGAVPPIDLSALSGATFTGNTSATCITDLFVSNIHGCSPVTFHSPLQHIGSLATGINSIAWGSGNTTSDNFSNILGGVSNTISGNSTGAHYNTIVGGIGNSISDFESATSDSNIIAGGEFNRMTARAQRDAIIGGISNLIGVGVGSVFSSVIVGGTSNVIPGSGITTNSIILGGSGNTMSVSNAAIIGGVDISATTGNTVYMNNLVVTQGDALVEHDHDGNTAISINNFDPGTDARTIFTLSNFGPGGVQTNGQISLMGPNFVPSGSFLGEFVPNSLNFLTAGGNASDRANINIGSRRGIDAQTRFFGGSSDFDSSSLLATFFLSGLTLSDSYSGGRLNAPKLRVRDAATVGYVLTSVDDLGNATWQESSFSGGSGNCITDLYITNRYGCSTITEHDSIQHISSSATGINSIAWGTGTTASGYASHAEGEGTIASGEFSHAEGKDTIATGDTAHAEGEESKAYGEDSHAEGKGTTASGGQSHAEGGMTQAIGGSSHAEGAATIAFGDSSHSEGEETQAIGEGSHAEGFLTVASGDWSHAGGTGSTASGYTSFVSATDSIVASKNSAILGGDNHTISGASLNSGIFAGDNNLINDGYFNSVIVGGGQNSIKTILSGTCGCPCGYVYNEVTELCGTYLPVITGSTGLEVVQGDQNDVFSEFGARFCMPNTYTTCWSGTGLESAVHFTANASNSSPAASAFWGEVGQAATEGRLNTTGVWSLPDTTPAMGWIGFSRCVTLPSPGEYLFALAGDNQIRASIDGDLLVINPLSGSTEHDKNFKTWWVFPVCFDVAGDHLIVLEGRNNGGPRSFGCEIIGPFPEHTFSATSTYHTFTGQTGVDTYTSTTIFSSADVIGGEFDTSDEVCPEGYGYDACTDSCLKTVSCSYSGVGENAIVGGCSNEIINSAQYSGILAGYNNSIAGVNYSTIIGGTDHTISGYGINNIILGGTDNKIDDTSYSTILGGAFNYITGATGGVNCDYSTIIGGTNNLIQPQDGSDKNTIIGGSSHEIRGRANETAIIGGVDGTIGTTPGGGVNQAVIIGGSGNVIDPGSHRSVILGGLGIVAPDGDTTYVPTLNIDTTPIQDNSLTDILVRDSADGIVKRRDIGTFAFSGGSGNCITDLYTTNIHACSPLNINPLDEGGVYFGSTSGVTIDVINSRIGVGTTTPQGEIDVNVAQNSDTRIKLQNVDTGISARTIVALTNRGPGSVDTHGLVCYMGTNFGSDALPTFKGEFLPNSFNMTTSGGNGAQRAHINIGSRCTTGETRFFGGDDDFNSSSLLGRFFTSGLTITDMTNTDTLRVRSAPTLGYVLTATDNLGTAEWVEPDYSACCTTQANPGPEAYFLQLSATTISATSIFVDTTNTSRIISSSPLNINDGDEGNVIIGDSGFVFDVTTDNLTINGSLSVGAADTKWEDGYLGNDEFIAILPTDFTLNNDTTLREYSIYTSDSGGTASIRNAGLAYYAMKIIPKGFTATDVELRGTALGSTVTPLNGEITTSSVFAHVAGNINTVLPLSPNIDGNGERYIIIQFEPNNLTDEIRGAKIYIERST